MTEGSKTQLQARPPRAPAAPPRAKTAVADPPAAGQPLLELEAGAASMREWLGSMWDHRGVTYVLARKDFHVRYKRATLGVLWAVAVPVLQAAVLILVFSHLVHLHGSVPYGAYVLSGVLGWNYFASIVPAGATSIVDGTGLTDKVWFPRAILAIVPCLSGLVGLGISMILLLIGAPLLGADLTSHILLLFPACLLLVLFTVGLSLVTSALQVYFRDVRFIVGAALMVWLYATPIMYPASKLGHLGNLLEINPMTGIVTLFHLAVVGQTVSNEGWQAPVLISVIATSLLLTIGIELQRRRDRLFVDLL
jgi:lipopolysaccharide transport system permease protein